MEFKDDLKPELERIDESIFNTNLDIKKLNRHIEDLEKDERNGMDRS